MMPPMNTDLLKYLPESHRIEPARTRDALRLSRQARRTKWSAWLSALLHSHRTTKERLTSDLAKSALR